MKTILALTLSLIATVSHAGPSVSGGIIHYEEFEKCSNQKENATFKIAAVMSPENILGIITEGELTTHLKCKSVQNKIVLNSKSEEVVWTCNEHRAGEGQLMVEVARLNNGLKIARIYRKDILQRNQNLYNMKCDQQVSN